MAPDAGADDACATSATSSRRTSATSKCPAGVCRDIGQRTASTVRANDSGLAVRQHEARSRDQMMDATASDRVLVTVDGRTAEVARGHDDPQRRAADGHHDPHAVQLSAACRPTAPAASAWWRSKRRAGRQLVASCSHPVEDGLVVHTETEQRAGVAADGARTAAGPGPRLARTGRVRRQAGRDVHPLPSRPPRASASSAGCASASAAR